MRFFTKQWYEQMQHIGIMTYCESDEEWEDFIRSFEEDGDDVYEYLKNELEEVKEELYTILPKKFHPFIDNGTINQPSLPKNVRDDLIQWFKEQERKIEKVVEEAAEYHERIRNLLPASLHEIVECGLHDSNVQYIFRNGSSLRFTVDYVNSPHAVKMVIDINDIISESSDNPIYEGMYWLYEEADIDSQGYRLGVLFSGAEWEVVAKEFNVTYYYRNEHIFGLEEEETHDDPLQPIPWDLPESYTSFLSKYNGGKPNHPFILLREKEIEIHRFIPLQELAIQEDLLPFADCHLGRLAFQKDQRIVYLDESGAVVNMAESFEQFLEQMLSKEYIEEVMEIEPLSLDQLEEAIYSEDLELNVRAWDFIWQNPNEHLPMIELALEHYLTHEDESKQMIGFVYFEQLKDILPESFRNKWDK